MDSDLKKWLAAEGFGENLHGLVVNRTTPLMRAAFLGDEAMAKKIIASGGDPLARNADGNQALWLACVDMHLRMIELLLDSGLDIDNRNDNGATPLMYAASSGRTEVVQLLLARGAALDIETLDGFTATDMAANLPILKLLRAAR